MKPRKVLVTGATGHIGSTLCRALLQSGMEVRALVRPTSERDALAGLELDVVEGDVLDQRSFVEAATDCDVIFHNAAVFALHPPASEAMSRVAVEGARHAVVAAASALARLVFTGSVVAVGFGSRPDQLLDETAWASGLTVPYYRAKVESEQVALESAEQLGVDLVRVLPTLVLGPGDHRVTPSSRVLVDMLRGKGATFDGGVNVIDVRDAASGMIAAAERGRSGGRYILGGENVLVRDLGAIVSRVTGAPVPHLGMPRWAFSAMAAVMELVATRGSPPAITRAVVHDVLGKYGWYDITRARTELGLATRPIIETVRDAARFFQSMRVVGPLPPMANAEASC